MFTDKGKTEDEDVEKASSELFCDIAAHIQLSTLKLRCWQTSVGVLNTY